MMSAWEVVALNKLYAPQGGFEALNQFFLTEKIDFNQVRKEIIIAYGKLEMIQGILFLHSSIH